MMDEFYSILLLSWLLVLILKSDGACSISWKTNDEYQELNIMKYNL